MMLRVLTVMALAAGLSACGSGSGGGRADAGPPQDKAWVRFGNLSPDTPAIDVCMKQSSGTDWGSPILAANDVAAGLTFPVMSKVIFVTPGTVDFRAVAAGSRDCNTAVGIDLTAQVLNPHGTYTITAVGLLAPGTTSSGPYRLQQYIEHQEAPAAGKARMRFVNVIPNSPPIWDGTTDGGVWDQQFTEAEMPFRFNASGVGIIDGYQDMAPNPALPLTIRATRPQDTPDLYVAPINLRSGIITAVWAVGLIGGTGEQRLSYFICDETNAANGGQTTCNRE